MNQISKTLFCLTIALGMTSLASAQSAPTKADKGEVQMKQKLEKHEASLPTRQKVQQEGSAKAAPPLAAAKSDKLAAEKTGADKANSVGKDESKFKVAAKSGKAAK
jgi:hypothetical protein